MPLIAATEYREMISISQGGTLPPDAGDRHDALAQLHPGHEPQVADVPQAETCLRR